VDVLTTRALGRATLARQLLLERADRPVPDTLEHLLGLQAQAPNAPYVGLWSRLAGFEAPALAKEIAERRAVRIPVMRNTIHLVTAGDARLLYPLTTPVLVRTFASSGFARNLAGLDLDPVLAAGRALLDESPRTGPELAALLQQSWPHHDATSLSYAVRFLLPVVQVPPRGIWGESGPATWALAETWLDAPLHADPEPDPVVLRYLAAFGPATVADVQAWCGLTRLRAVVDRLRDRLRVFRDEAGRELFDLPDAPRPDPDIPAPPRFLPEYDNVLLSHADRARVIPDNRRPPLPPGNGGTTGTVLVDGLMRGTWKITRSAGGTGGAATLTVEPYDRLSAPDRAAVAEEGARLLGFAAADADDHDIRM
jgi:hypothetical protein